MFFAKQLLKINFIIIENARWVCYVYLEINGDKRLQNAH